MSGAHWDMAYGQGDTTRSWYQAEPSESLCSLERLDVSSDDSVIDVGGGASTLVDALLDRGHRDLAVLDVSALGLQAARVRLGSRAAGVDWILADLRAWQPERTWRVWHDRAALHFFAEQSERDRYLEALTKATQPESIGVFATFALDGPTHCSGLPVVRYDAAAMAELLGPGWRLEFDQRQVHTTPAGGTQPFIWTGFRRLA